MRFESIDFNERFIATVPSDHDPVELRELFSPAFIDWITRLPSQVDFGITEAQLFFTPERGKGASVVIPYSAITSLEYGQKAGRRVGAAILVNPLLLFSKKRKHFFTIAFKDKDGKEQAVVLELGKDIVRTTLTIVETRSGKEIEYQDDDARKAGRGGH